MKLRICAALLVLALALGLGGCGKGIAGVWAWELDLTQLMAEDMGAALGADGIEPPEKMELTVLLTLNRDGSFTMAVDQEAGAASAEAFFQGLAPVLKELYYASFESRGTSREKLDGLLEKQGKTLDGLVAELMTHLSADELLAAYGVDRSGYWVQEGDRLYLLAEKDGQDRSESLRFTLSGNEMTLTEMQSESLLHNERVEAQVILPVTLTRR